MMALKRLPGLIALALAVALPALFIANSEAIEDWWKLRDYTPSEQVQHLADVTTMTDKAQRLFYVNHPEIVVSKERFRQVCTHNEQTIVLGCYHPVNNGIAVYDVPDERLNGIEEVTAAHEMLHAAYDRLGDDGRTRVNALLENYYATGMKDERVAKTIDSYKKFEPNDVVNEMHSIFATEMDTLPAELEDYYRQYFNDRKKVTAFSNQYEAVFTQSQQQLQGIKSQIETLKLELDSDKARVEVEEEYLNRESERMQGLREQSRVEEYNQAVAPYNERVNRYRSLVNAYNNKVQKLNALVEHYNQLAYTQEGLYKSLDTRL